ncbi:hypothetical protein IMG5_099610 [Ichthyophthirius multifiliis]|uniref:U3 small nucleolar RNA-associated protein 11 n=1 Tax=Ichthyophthirius multifiliis TaxID=5932 RepID=G0QS68_ICHMU|nr:hypothetical protein IMG5_099610 [Ichthyophthirius multifiliis]EGR31933.1 hypothetical protein IMG5_099610 [Ichthyophthirius multifiliis]|eukprot:XP_004035419.1 hypothetical protein IMG5_099610 [Ichthyophthirius multifiliis]
MSFTTFKNLKIGRKHRERGQLKEREHLGLLEKKQDYKKRAKHYHKINDILNNLKQKARLKNDDEFYFKMQRAKIIDGKHVEQNQEDENEDFDKNEFKSLVKAKNMNLIKVQKHKDMKQIQKLQAQLHNLEGPKMNQQKYFVDSKEEFDNFQIEKDNQILNQPENLVFIFKKIFIQLFIFQQRNRRNHYKEKLKNLIKNLKKYKRIMKKWKKHILNWIIKKICQQYLSIYLKYKNQQKKEKRRIRKYKNGEVAKFFRERKR